MFSKNLKHVSVAQLIHEISLKTFKIEFFNFHDFVSFFTYFFHLNVLFKNMLSGALSLTITFRKDQKSQNHSGMVIFNEKILFLVVLVSKEI